MLEKEGVGQIAVLELRTPFSLFSKSYPKTFFQPELAGARWWKIEILDWTEDERLTFTNLENPLAAMSYLRTNEKIVLD